MNSGDYIDPIRSCDLGDQGGGRFIAAVSIGPNGEESFVLASRDSIGDESVVFDGRGVDHEQNGPLSADWWARTWGVR